MTKSRVRQTLKTENISGAYLWGRGTTQACSNTAFNGTFLPGVSVTLAQSGASFQMATADVDTSGPCTWVGTYTEDGQVARVAGNYSCSTGEMGTFSFFEIQSSISASWVASARYPRSAARHAISLA